MQKGIPVVGVPKTIDNDVGGTVATFGFDTAVATATDAIDKLHSTAESHERVMVVEVMGRHAGFIALNAGISGSADVILIPEIPFDIGKVCDKIRRREAEGRHFSIVVVAEGAVPRGGAVSLIDPEHERLGGIADKVANSVQQMTGKETRSLVLGHLQRGGAAPPPSIGCWACGSAPPRCGSSRRDASAIWWRYDRHRRRPPGPSARHPQASALGLRHHRHGAGSGDQSGRLTVGRSDSVLFILRLCASAAITFFPPIPRPSSPPSPPPGG
jgi:hypothetical protein